jgi:hypothetical protein
MFRLTMRRSPGDIKGLAHALDTASSDNQRSHGTLSNRLGLGWAQIGVSVTLVLCHSYCACVNIKAIDFLLIPLIKVSEFSVLPQQRERRTMPMDYRCCDMQPNEPARRWTRS